MQLCLLALNPNCNHKYYGLKESRCPITVGHSGLSSESVSLDPSQLISFCFLEHHLKGRNEADLNSSFNMTCPFEIVQITVSDCHVELRAWMWNAPKSDWSQILGHKSTFCWETWLLRGWKFISFHEKTCLPAGKKFKDCYLSMWRERDVCNFATWVKVLWDFWNWIGWGMRLWCNIWIAPWGESQWVAQVCVISYKVVRQNCVKG